MDYFKEAKQDAYKLLPSLKALQRKVEKMENNVLGSSLSPDDQLMFSCLLKFCHETRGVIWDLEYLQKPVKAEGSVHLNSSGRFEMDGVNYYFTSGSPIEVLEYDEFDDVHRWVLTRIEHSEKRGGYYAVGVDQPLWSCKVRIR